MPNKVFSRIAFLCLTGFIASYVFAQQPAFPGAEGAGMYTSGGRGTAVAPTTVFEVTNLTDNNTSGSLRYACSQSTASYPNRTIVFKVSGTIHLLSRLSIPKNTTIAGQTAPGDGICIADYPVVINGDNIIVRYLRIRMGDKNQLKTSPSGCGVPVAPFTASCMPLDGSGGDDAFGDLGHKNIIIDHCSISWSTDEAFTFYRGDSLTLQWNFIEEPLNYSYHFETGDADFEHHGYGGIWGSRHGSFHHNLFAHCQSRNPRFGGNNTYNGDVESADFRNNVIYDWGLYTVYGGEGGEYNLVNNYYKYGPNTGSGTKFRIVNVDSNITYGYGKYFLNGNYVDGSPANTANNWSGAYLMSGNAADSVRSKQTAPFLSTYPQITSQSALDAYEAVINSGGASLPRRDTLDRRIVNDVRYRAGKIIDVQGNYPHGTPYAQTVNAWPVLNSTGAPTDTDHDGMPDTWEAANGLNSNDASDRQTVASNGYTNLENYLNGIVNTSPEVYFSGTTNAFSQAGATPSATQTINISGLNLSGNVRLAPPVGFQISTDGGTTWVDANGSVTLTPNAGNLASTVLSIRFNGDTVGVYSGYIVASTAGVTNFYFPLNGKKSITAPTGPATATWSLLNTQDPVTTGGITAGSQTLGSAISGMQYGNSFGGINGWQRVATTVFLPVNFNTNAYTEYTITAPAGRTFTDTAFAISALGGGTGTARMAIYYSKDGFATSNSLGSVIYNGITYANSTNNTASVSLLNTSTTPLTGQQVAKISCNIAVAPGETLTIRVYAWITGSGNRYFASQNVVASGFTSEGAATLPLKLLGFKATLKDSHVGLDWQTTNEVNTEKFEIQSSATGLQYVSVGTVAAKNSWGNHDYNFTDPDLLMATRFYRLKLLDKNGNFNYSHTIVLNSQSAGKIMVFPSPAETTVTVMFPSLKKRTTLQIWSSEGLLLQSFSLAEGTTQTNINVQGFSKGVCFIRLEGTEQNASFLKR